MADNNRTREVKNFIGHPCSIAPLLLDRTDEMGDWRNTDPRHLAQRLGVELDDLVQRTSRSHNAIEAIRGVAAEHDDGLEALLDAQADYALKTANLAYRVVTMTLAALERGNLIAPSQRQETEASHA